MPCSQCFHTQRGVPREELVSFSQGIVCFEMKKHLKEYVTHMYINAYIGI